MKFLFLFTLFLSIFIPLKLSAVIAQQEQDYITKFKHQKQSNFKQNEHSFVLDNGLEALIISDPTAKQSHVSMSVNVGYWHEPKEHRGIAHYLEHMLFLGTKTYPKEDEYSDYIKKNNGTKNAYTTTEETNYYFSINHTALEGALDRFSKFFFEPTFNPEFAERELTNVNSEYEKNLCSNPHKFMHIRRISSNPQHPNYETFQGNKETLSKISHEVLTKFHSDFYTANRMKLVIITAESITKIKDLISEKFKNIPAGINQDDNSTTDFLYNNDQLARIIEFKPSGDHHEIKLIFMMPLSEYSYAASIIIDLLNRKDAGSLNDILKKNGLIVEMNSNITSHKKEKMITTTLAVPDGMEKSWKNICEKIFSYLGNLRNESLSKEYFEEKKINKQIIYLNKQPQSSLAEAMSISNKMHKYPANIADSVEELLAADYNNNDFQEVLKFLVPSNMQVIMTNSNLSLEDNNVKTDKFFDMVYRISKISQEDISYIENSNINFDNLYPKTNSFIPQSFDYKHAMNPNIQCKNDNFGRLLCKVEHINEQALAYYNFLLLTPKNLTLQEYSTFVLYLNCLNQSAAKWMGPAKELGYIATLALKHNGYELFFKGYSDKIITFISQYIDNLQNISLSQNEFDSIKNKLVENIVSAPKKTSVYMQAYEKLGSILNYHKCDDQDIISEFEKLNLSDITHFSKTKINEMFILAGGCGDVCTAEIDSCISLLFDKYNAKPFAVDLHKINKSISFNDGEHFYYHDKIPQKQNAYMGYYYLGQLNPNIGAIAMIGEKILSTNFFETLRTREEIGYMVQAFSYIKSAVSGFGLIVQSDKSLEFIYNRIKQWKNCADEIISSTSKEDFENIRKSILEKIIKPDEKLNEKYASFYQSVFYKNGNFAWKDCVIESLKSITQQDVADLFKKAFSEENGAGIVVLMEGAECEEKSSENFVPQGQKITNIKDFHKSAKFCILE